eukprot:TRINITY_DN75023_c0_g1_i1.p1 TRINITY_DN75023_c0_g1~~TRINITY_DN75023_c0_g1_i1.p1  ORF type:complete len:429 (-),score=102.87 TRINITY_DN75023_c0_g1_i1:119-1327(-)
MAGVAVSAGRMPRLSRGLHRRFFGLVTLATAAFLACDSLRAQSRPPAQAFSMQDLEDYKRKAHRFMGDLGPKKSRTKVLLTAGGWELVFKQKKRQIMPSFGLRETPPNRVEMGRLMAAVEGTTEELKGFPFTSSNAGALQIDFPRVEGHLGVSLVDPPANLDYDEAKQAVQVSYGQRLPVVGDLQVNVLSSGDWNANFSRDLEEIGYLKGTLDAQLDWTMDLETQYKPFRGVTPTITYGANQEGMKVQAKLARQLGNHVHGSYAVGNLPGKYAPTDFVHDCKVVLASESADGKKKKKDAEDGLRHTMEFQGAYDRRLPNVPVRGSVAYTASFRDNSLEASMDLDRYRLRCSTPRGQVSFALAAKKSEDSEDRQKEMALQIGKVSAAATLVNKEPRLRFSVGN